MKKLIACPLKANNKTILLLGIECKKAKAIKRTTWNVLLSRKILFFVDVYDKNYNNINLCSILLDFYYF